MKCMNCKHDLAEHVLTVDRCNHKAGPDAHCTCPEYVLPDEPTQLAHSKTTRWVAPCPHCEASAEWNSTGNTLTLVYEMNCPDCGPVRWLAGKP